MPIVALGGVVIALVATLLILAAAVIMEAFKQALPDWHLPGFGSIADWWGHQIASVAHWTARQFGQAIHPLEQLVTWPISWVQRNWTAIMRTSAAILHALTYWTVSAIPWLIDHVKAYALYLYNGAMAYATAAIAQVRAEIGAVYTSLYNFVGARIAAVVNLANYLAAQVRAYAAALAAELRTEIGAVYTTLYNFVASRIAAVVALANYLTAQATAYAAALAAELRDDIAATRAALIAYCDAKVAQVVDAAIANEHVLFGSAIAAVWPRALDEVDAVIAAADKDFADAIANLRGLRGISLANPFAVVGALVGVVTGLLRFTRDCTIPNCRNLSQVGRDLQSLFGMVESDLLIGFIAEAAHDPAGVAASVHELLGPVLAEAADTVRSQTAA